MTEHFPRYRHKATPTNILGLWKSRSRRRVLTSLVPVPATTL